MIREVASDPSKLRSMRRWVVQWWTRPTHTGPSPLTVHLPTILPQFLSSFLPLFPFNPELHVPRPGSTQQHELTYHQKRWRPVAISSRESCHCQPSRPTQALTIPIIYFKFESPALAPHCSAAPSAPPALKNQKAAGPTARVTHDAGPYFSEPTPH